MNEAVIKILKNNLWYLGTYSDEPNAVPVGFKDVTPDGKLIIADVFLEQTLKNIEANGKIAISACDEKTMEGYQIKGTAEYVTEGPIFDNMSKMVEAIFKGKLHAKGVVVATPEKVIVTTPGPDNKKVL